MLLARYLNSLNLSGVQFRPISYIPFYKDTTGIRYKGVQIHIIDRAKLNMIQVQIAILEALIHLFPDNNIFDRAKPERINSFDKAVGTDDIRRELQNNISVEEILNRIDQLDEQFMRKREKYLLYK